MSNITQAPDTGWSRIPNYVVYIFQGLIVGLPNLIMALSIYSHHALRIRKEYIIITGTLLADSFNQLAYTAAGIYRTAMIVTGRWNTKFTLSQCVTLVHTTLWAWFYPLATLMLAVTSFDRLMAVAFPLRYISWSSSYAKGLVGAAYAYCILPAVIVVVAILLGEDGRRLVGPGVVVENCVALFGFPELRDIWVFTSINAFPAAAILLYMLVWVVYKRKKAQVESSTRRAEEQTMEMKKQRKVTISIGISCICTIFLYIVPSKAAYYFWDTGQNLLATACWTLSSLNPLCNTIIYPLHHRELRQGLKAMFQCKTMPPDLRLWQTVQQPKRSTKSSKPTAQSSQPGNLAEVA